jgi:hypothetical protein
MAPTFDQIVFADLSAFSVGGTAVDAIQSLQVARAADTKHFYGWGQAKPRLSMGTPSTGNGSFSYLASNGSQSSATMDWSTILTGATVITCSGGMYPSGTTQVISFSGCAFGGQSEGMNAKGEMQVNINFSFASGTF